jgi:hypothetical protein
MVAKALPQAQATKKNIKSGCESLKRLLDSIYIIRQLKYLSLSLSFFIFRVLFWLAQQR